MHDLVQQIEDASQVIDISMRQSDWIKTIPRSPGWYVLATDAPLDILGGLVHPATSIRQYRIGERVKRAESIRALGLLLEGENGSIVPVYNGHARNLNARAREHWNGHPKTGCLALAQYESLSAHRWEFRYTEITALRSKPEDSATLRTIGEQLWRATHGWPILCVE